MGKISITREAEAEKNPEKVIHEAFKLFSVCVARGHKGKFI